MNIIGNNVDISWKKWSNLLMNEMINVYAGFVSVSCVDDLY